MKILFITERDLSDGGAQVIPETPVSYVNRGFEVHYISCNASHPSDNDSMWNGVNLHKRRLYMHGLTFLKKLRYLKFFYNWALSAEFLRTSIPVAADLHAKLSFDVLYGYEVFGVLALIKLKKKIKGPLPKMISRFQGTILYPKLDNKFARLLLFNHFRAMKFDADICVMTNDGTFGDKVLRKLNPDCKKILFLFNGVDIKHSSIDQTRRIRTACGVDRQVMCLTVSRLAKWKRLDRSIMAISLLPENVRARTMLIIVGDGGEAEKLRSLVRSLDLESCIRFSGRIPNSEAQTYIAASDIFLSFYELSNVGNPLLEALSLGRAIITLNNGATGTVIKDGYNGMLLEESQGIEKRIASALVKIINDVSLRESLGQNALTYSRENIFSWEERMNREIDAVMGLFS